MQITLRTTLDELFTCGIISVRTKNGLKRGGMSTLRDVVDFSDEPTDLLRLNGFGKKSYNEIVSLLNRMRSPKGSLNSNFSPNDFLLVPEEVKPILCKAYNKLFEQTDEINQYFKSLYPSVEILHTTILNDKNVLLAINKNFSMYENIKLRRLYSLYLSDSINNMKTLDCEENDTVIEYQSIFNGFQPVIEKFSYIEKAQYFLSPLTRKFLQTLYVHMRETQLKGRAKLFAESYAPNFEELVALFNEPIEKYRALFPGTHMLKSAKEIFDFNLKLQSKFDAYYYMDDNEIQPHIIAYKYPFLISIERKFISEHICIYRTEPLFYILYNYMRVSDVIGNRIFSLMYGIFDGTAYTVGYLSNQFGFTRSHIQYLVLNRLEVLTSDIILSNNWEQYDNLLSLPYITANCAEYMMIKERERLSFDFRIFAHLLLLVGERNLKVDSVKDVDTIKTYTFPNQYVIFEINNSTIVLNRRVMPSINLSDCIKRFHELTTGRYKYDTCISIEDLIKDVDSIERDNALKLLTHIAQNCFGLEIDDNNRIFVKKNYVDVSYELYLILEKIGKPLTLEELFLLFKQNNQYHKFTNSSQIRSYLLRHPEIKPIGRSSRYGLVSWDNVYYGSIRDLLIELLEDSSVPLHLGVLYDAIKQHYPTTNIKSIVSSMNYDTLSRFVQFNDGYFGLKTKPYDKSYIVCNLDRQRFNFEQRLKDFRAFVDEYKRYPVSSNGSHESSLFSWLYNVQNGLLDITDKQEQELKEQLNNYELNYIPRNSTEYAFRNNCLKYKAYINRYFKLPTISSDPELYNWLRRSKANYDSYIDHRRKYLNDLFDYIYSLGFSI